MRFISKAEHSAHTHSELASNAADPGPLGPGRDNRRHLVRVAILQLPPAKLGTVGPGPAQTGPLTSLVRHCEAFDHVTLR
jgi:hypothetical protein